MTPSKLYEALHALIRVRVPLHIWGACGVGKSQIVAQVADDLGYAFLDVRAVQLDPVDLRGLPRIADHQTEWAPPKFLPTTGQGILFLDELTSAPQMTQAGCYQLVLDRKLGEYVLPEGWVVIAAGKPGLRTRRAFLYATPPSKSVCPFGAGSQPGRLVQMGHRVRRAPRDHRLPSIEARAVAHSRNELRRKRLADSAFLGDGIACAHWRC